MKKIALFFAAAVVASQAQAWGDREQGILAGIASTLIVQHIAESNRRADTRPMPEVRQEVPVHAPVVVSRPGAVYSDRPLRCVSRPVLWDQFTGNPIRYETFCQ